MCRLREIARRIGIVAGRLAVSGSQTVQVVLVGCAYVLMLTDRPPHEDETLSSFVGRGEMRGARWARIVAPVIDRLFMLLGEGPGHCRRNVEPAFLRLEPTL